jgi:hypothetical protein
MPQRAKRDPRLVEHEGRQKARHDRRRHILGPDGDEVTTAVEACECSAASRTDPVIDDSPRYEDCARAGQSRAQIEIDVLAVHPEIGVENVTAFGQRF